jgi:hypothetical protein
VGFLLFADTDRQNRLYISFILNNGGDERMKRIIHRRWLAGALTAALLAAMPANALAAEQATPATPAPKTSESALTPGAPPISRPTPQLSQEQALAKLKEHLPVPKETASLVINGHLNAQPGRLSWEFSIELHEGNGSMTGYGFAAVDATTGRILHYWGQNPDTGYIRTGPVPPARPEAEAREQAWKLVQQLYPEAVAKVKPAEAPAYVPTPFGMPAEAYAFNWVEHRNGIPMPSSQITVALDKSTLEVASLSYALQDGVSVSDATATVTPEQAMKRWKETVQPRLMYRAIAENVPTGSRTTGYELVYMFEGTGLLVDALTGEFSAARSPVQLYQEAKPVPAGEEPAVALPLGPITEEAATKAAAAVLQAPAGAQLIVEQERYEPTGLSVRHMTPGGSGTVVFDQKTGLIRQAYRSLPSQGAPAAEVTPAQEEQAKQVALRVVQQYFSQIRSELRLETAPNPIPIRQDNRYRRFRFQRYVNGVQAGYDGVHVTVDLQSMTWRDMSSNWTTGVEFPPVTNVMTPTKALETLFASHKAELIYQPVIKIAQAPMMGMPYEPPTEAALVYQLSGTGGMVLNAYTGADAPPAPETPNAMEAALKRAAGNWAEGELRYMLRLNLLTADTLNPDAPLSRAEAVKWLLNSQRMGYSYSQTTLPFTDVDQSHSAYDAVASAYAQGWLRPAGEATEFRPDDRATRADFAVWAVRMLGLGDLARTNLAVQGRFTDLAGLTAEQRNAANFLEALALVSSGEKFRGAEPITQAEAAALVVRIINLKFTR